MRARRWSESGVDYLSDALALLGGWTHEGREIKRVLRLDDAQHAALVAAGYKPRDGKHPVLASRTMYVDDPDGNEVEFICRAPAQQ